MPLMMARPTKHPKTGMYQFRRGVPDDLRALVGKREEKRSLGTKDPEEAKRRFAEVWQKVDARWANLREGVKKLTEREAHEAAIVFYENWLATHRDQPSDQFLWHTELYDQMWTKQGHDPEMSTGGTIVTTDLFYPSMRRICFQQADIMAEDKGWNLDRGGRNNLARAIGAALQRASLVIEQQAQGIYRESTDIAPRSNTSTQLISQLPSIPFTFEMMLEDWKRERQPRSRTIYESTNMVRKLEALLGFSDVRRLTTEHLIAWKEALRADGLSPTTIRNGKLAAIRAMLTVAVQNRRRPANPADGVVIAVKREPGDRVRGYSDTEAVTVLTAAKAAKDPVRRWVPLLCAYSGARLGDVCHLRAEDVVEVRGIATMSISPEAGPLKNRTSVRTIPLHPAVIDAGVLEFVSSRSGPFFPSCGSTVSGREA